VAVTNRAIRIEKCESIVACVSWIYEAVGVMAERGELDDDELIRILRAAARIKELARAERKGVPLCSKTTP
jgi:hypothetical protein